jgi:hypothetical protein
MGAMSVSKSFGAESAVTLSVAPIGLDMSRFDLPVEDVVSYVRWSLLQDVDVIAHLLYLDELDWSPSEYKRARDSSPLLDVFDREEGSVRRTPAQRQMPKATIQRC